MKYFLPTGEWPLMEKPYHDLMKHIGLTLGTEKDSDILILAGGADIGMRHGRDLAEFHLYDTWTSQKKPVIGICRGMQLMLHLHDGELIEHIPDESIEIMHTTITGDWRGQSSWHTTNLGLLTNSRHHQGFTEVPDFWDVIDKTDDGVIEAVQMNVHGKNQFAVQWHPEHNEMKNTLAQDWWIETVKSIL